jgi:hypothetical protein
MRPGPMRGPRRGASRSARRASARSAGQQARRRRRQRDGRRRLTRAFRKGPAAAAPRRALERAGSVPAGQCREVGRAESALPRRSLSRKPLRAVRQRLPDCAAERCGDPTSAGPRADRRSKQARRAGANPSPSSRSDRCRQGQSPPMERSLSSLHRGRRVRAPNILGVGRFRHSRCPDLNFHRLTCSAYVTQT